MSSEENKAFVRRAFEEVMQDPDGAMARFVTPDFLDHNPPPGATAGTRDGVGEVRCDDHHRADTRRFDGVLLQRRGQRCRDAGGHVLRGGPLRPGEHVAAVEDDGVCIRPAHADADAIARLLLPARR